MAVLSLKKQANVSSEERSSPQASGLTRYSAPPSCLCSMNLLFPLRPCKKRIRLRFGFQLLGCLIVFAFRPTPGSLSLRARDFQ